MNTFFIIVGTLLMSLSLNCFLEPCGIVTGGVTGIGIILESLSDNTIKIWLTNLAINTPLIYLGYKKRGLVFIRKTLLATILLSLMLILTEGLPAMEIDLFLSSIFGGIIMGAGLGLVFRAGATTGGSDLLASLIHRKYFPINVTKIILLIDSFVIMLGFFVFGATPTMYAIVTVYVVTKVMDLVLEGLGFVKASFIISDKTEEIAETVLNQLERGATGLNGKGMYTHNNKTILMCVVSSKQLPKLKKIVSNIDKNAFMLVTDVREVLGCFD